LYLFLTFKLMQDTMADEDEARRLLDEDDESEGGKTSVDGGGTSGKSPAAVEASVGSLEARLKNSLSLSKLPNCASKKNNLEPTCSNQEIIKNIRKGMLDAPGLHGGTSSIPAGVSSFRPNGEAWGAAPYEKNVFNQKRYLGLSFDPVTFVCSSCQDEHRILEPMGGGEGGTHPSQVSSAYQTRHSRLL
jgi:hypothetical protein